MKCIPAMGVAAFVLLGVLAVPQPPCGGSSPQPWRPAPPDPSAPAHGAAAADSSAITADSTLAFVLRMGSRLYPDWEETRDVSLRNLFFIGDTPFRGEVTAFMPDFGIIDGKPRNCSPRLGNPAVRVIVHADSGAVDSTWAFLNFPPHYSPRSFFTFRLIEVKGYREPGALPPAGKPKREE